MEAKKYLHQVPLLSEGVRVPSQLVKAQGSRVATHQNNALSIKEMDKTEKPYQPPIIYMAVNPCPENFY